MTPSAAKSHEGGLGVTEQIERYRTAFIAVVVMILIAAFTGGYILAHENLKLPSWVPVLGKSYFDLKADFQTAQAVTPGQGQAVTIAGAKIGEIASVELHQGVARVSMRVTPKYAQYIYKDATLLLRPKTQLQDITVEVSPGTPASGRLRSSEVIPLSQTAANVDFDELLAGLDAETRFYLQELLAGLGEGLNENGKALSATFKRFSPTARLLQEISQELQTRHVEIARSVHNFRLLIEALGGKDTQLAQLIEASNSVFATFAAEDSSFQRTLQLLPGALRKTAVGLGKLGAASAVVGPTLHALTPFATSLAPAQEATKRAAETTTPIIKNQIRPFARKILPVVNSIGPSTRQLSEAFPKLASSFGVINEFFNELAYNPGPSKGGFMFFLDWANHNANSVVSSSDAHGPLGRTLLYFNCNVVPILAPAAKVNPTVNLIVGLLNPPSKATCQSQGLIAPGAGLARAHSSAYGSSTSAATGFSQLSAGVLGLSGPELTQLLSASAAGGGR
jgi:phospholipid/cholesterol/gamma-HCH transport system substrate-binding protein